MKFLKQTELLDLSFSYHYYLLPLTQKLPIRGIESNGISTREGILIKVCDKDGYSGWGECSPLPGLHLENLDDCYNLLEEWSADFQEVKFCPKNFDPGLPLAGLVAEAEEETDDEEIEEDDDGDEYEGEEDEDAGPEQDLPSVLLYAFEQALWSWYCNRYSKEMTQKAQNNFLVLPSSTSPLKVAINQLVLDMDNFVPEVTGEGESEGGSKFFKIKLGSASVEKELSRLENFFLRLNKFYKELGTELDYKVVLDAAGAFDLSSLEKFWQGISSLIKKQIISASNLQYIEDPFKNSELLSSPQLREWGIPVGIDDLLLDFIDHQGDVQISKIPSSVVALVIKPTLLGLSVTVRILRTLAESGALQNMQVVLSSTFDSALTIATLAMLT
ncbi:MAG: hypothetical protein HQK53_15060, partial [Oligoflexia bacterium]|nr:hypothetical protein [Oligoflexia bacterium]